MKSRRSWAGSSTSPWPVNSCDHSSKYVELKRSIDALKGIKNPVMNVEYQNKFNKYGK